MGSERTCARRLLLLLLLAKSTSRTENTACRCRICGVARVIGAKAPKCARSVGLTKHVGGIGGAARRVAMAMESRKGVAGRCSDVAGIQECCR